MAEQDEDDKLSQEQQAIREQCSEIWSSLWCFQIDNECDERDGSINYKKGRTTETQECWAWMRFHSCNGSGGCGVQLSLPSPAMPNSATHLRVGIVSWYEFNEMEKKVCHPILFMWSMPKPTELHHWLIFHFKGILSECPLFSALWVKVPINLRLSWGLVEGWKRIRHWIFYQKKEFSTYGASRQNCRPFESTSGMNVVIRPKNGNKAYLCTRKQGVRVKLPTGRDIRGQTPRERKPSNEWADFDPCTAATIKGVSAFW